MTFFKSLIILPLLLLLTAPTSPAPANPKMHLPKRLIALEEHALFPSLPATGAFYENSFKAFPNALTKLQDLSSGRLKDMDSGHIALQILSSIPGMAPTNPSGCVAANNELAAAISKYPSRLAGFAALPMAYPNLAAAELHRAVTELGFVGAMIDNHLPNGTYYDSPLYHPIFAMASNLSVPLYIHPAPPTQTQLETSFLSPSYPVQTAFKLSSSAWGWHASVGLYLIRLYASGLFIKFPNLKIIIGHDGETLPMMIDRVDDSKLRSDQKFSEVWNRNVWVTTAGFFHLRNFEMLLKVTRRDRVMFSVDYPLVNITDGWEFVQEVARSGVLSDEEMDAFAYGNAERLLGLNGTTSNDES